MCRDDGDGGIMHYGMIHIREKMEAGRVWWGEERKEGLFPPHMYTAIVKHCLVVNEYYERVE